MHIEPPDSRIVNWPPAQAEQCPRCENDGMITVLYRPAIPVITVGSHNPQRVPAPKPSTHLDNYEELAPCPSCVKGFRIEFAVGVKKNQKDEIVDDWWSTRQGPWGRDGYWRGRDPH